jgi:UDP-2,3-diacylglucosamine pyrophosphatase LpxH
MKTLIISDIHLGSPLVDKKTELMNLMKLDIYDTIILNGDIFDVWEKSFDNILLANFDFVNLLKKISSKKIVYFLLGNHDPHISEIEKVFPNIVVLKELLIDEDILIVHGDQFDDLVIKYSWFAKLIFIPNWLCERLFHWNLKASFREFFYSIANKRDKPYYSKLVGDIENEAKKYYENKCRYLVMGHTHTPKRVDIDNFSYINCGDIIHNKVCLEFDENKKFKFIEV